MLVSSLLCQQRTVDVRCWVINRIQLVLTFGSRGAAGFGVKSYLGSNNLSLILSLKALNGPMSLCQYGSGTHLQVYLYFSLTAEAEPRTLR